MSEISGKNKYERIYFRDVFTKLKLITNTDEKHLVQTLDIKPKTFLFHLNKFFTACFLDEYKILKYR